MLNRAKPYPSCYSQDKVADLTLKLLLLSLVGMQVPLMKRDTKNRDGENLKLQSENRNMHSILKQFEVDFHRPLD